MNFEVLRNKMSVDNHHEKYEVYVCFKPEWFKIINGECFENLVLPEDCCVHYIHDELMNDNDVLSKFDDLHIKDWFIVPKIEDAKRFKVYHILAE